MGHSRNDMAMTHASRFIAVLPSTCPLFKDRRVLTRTISPLAMQGAAQSPAEPANINPLWWLRAATNRDAHATTYQDARHTTIGKVNIPRSQMRRSHKSG